MGRSSRRGLAVAGIEVAAVAALLAWADALLHASPGSWIDQLTAVGRSIFWLFLCYLPIALVLALGMRHRAWVLRVVLFGFLTGQSLLYWYRLGVDGALLSLKSLLLFLAILLAAAVVAWLLAALLMLLPHRLRIAQLLLVGTLTLTALFLVRHPTPPPATAWPAVPPRQAPDMPNVLLITLDTVRPDHLGAYGYTKIRTPHLDRIASDGLLVLRGIAQAPTTPVSHASILTGVLPPKHGLRDFNARRPVTEQHFLLQEILSKAGYITGAIIAATTLAPAFGLGRGFDVYHYVESDAGYIFSGLERSLLPATLQFFGIARDRTVYRSGAQQTEDALRWIDRYREVPFFLWVHYFDAHDPYFPPADAKHPTAHPGRKPKERSGRSFEYDSEIVGVDNHVGLLVERLRSYGLLDNTVLAVISDHGEGLGDHGYVGHTKRVFQEQLRLAFFVRFPGRIPAGSIISTRVRSIDLFPTVLELIGLPEPPGVDGVSLLGEIGAEAPDRVAFSETLAPSRKGQKLVSVIDGRWKLIRSLAGEDLLFDLANDPGELRDLSRERTEHVTRLGSLLDGYLAMGTEASPIEETEVDAELRRQLEALGYINR